MKTYQNLFQKGQWQSPLKNVNDAQLVLIFGDRKLASNPNILQEVKAAYPIANVIGCTTSGEILDEEIHDDSLCLTALELKHASIKVAQQNLMNDLPFEETVKNLAKDLPTEGLRYVLVLSDGQEVNGTQLVQNLAEELPESVVITGGLAGDGTNFSETVVWCNGQASPGKIVVCGFYGEQLEVSHGSMGGWDPFGPVRLVTKSQSNVLHVLDNKPALQIYKQYLGEYADDLPSSALLFPLMVTLKDGRSVIRTILSINEDDNSMIFAGDIPEGAKAQMMMANFDRLIDGAEGAATCALKQVPNASHEDGLVLMISCVGRRLVLKQRAEEELEAVKEVFGDQFSYAGFYSYGEISPIVGNDTCALHNQTMTITTLYEKHA